MRSGPAWQSTTVLGKWGSGGTERLTVASLQGRCMVRSRPLSVNASGVRISHRRVQCRDVGPDGLYLYFSPSWPGTLVRGSSRTEDTVVTVAELQLGARIRALRQARQLTLRDVAARAGVTESFLSQVERDIASPSIATVQRIARALDLSIAQLFAEEPRDRPGRPARGSPAGRLPGAQGRRRVPDHESRGRLQVIISTIEPGGGTGAEPYTHDSDEEVVVVLSGVLDAVGRATSTTSCARATPSRSPRGCRTGTPTTGQPGHASCSASRLRASERHRALGTRAGRYDGRACTPSSWPAAAGPDSTLSAVPSAQSPSCRCSVSGRSSRRPRRGCRPTTSRS